MGLNLFYFRAILSVFLATFCKNHGIFNRLFKFANDYIYTNQD